MERFKKLISVCKGSVDLCVNAHKDCYTPISEYFKGRPEAEDIDPEILVKIIEADTLITIHFYPDTPVGFHLVIHYDLDLALDEALKIVREIEEERAAETKLLSIHTKKNK